MEQSDVFSQVNLNYNGKNQQIGLRQFRQQAALKEKSQSKKQIVAEISKKHHHNNHQLTSSPQKYAHSSHDIPSINYNHINPLNHSKKYDYLSNQIQQILPQPSQEQQQYFQSQNQQQLQFQEGMNAKYKESSVTETILQILENNKKLLNLRAMKMNRGQIYRSEGQRNKDELNMNQNKQNNFRLNNLRKKNNLKITKLDEIIISPNIMNPIQLYNQQEGNLPQKYFDSQKQQQQYQQLEESYKFDLLQKDHLVKLQYQQQQFINLKYYHDLSYIQNQLSSNHLFLLQISLLFLNISTTLSKINYNSNNLSMVDDKNTNNNYGNESYDVVDGQNLKLKIEEQIKNIISELNGKTVELKNIVQENEICLKEINDICNGIQKDVEQEKYNQQKEFIGIQQIEQNELINLKEQIILNVSELMNQQKISQLNQEIQEYQLYVNNYSKNNNTNNQGSNGDTLKSHLNKIIDIHKQLKLSQEQNHLLQHQNTFLSNKLNQNKNNHNINNNNNNNNNNNYKNNIWQERYSSKVNELHTIFKEYSLFQHPISKTLNEKTQQIQQLEKEKQILDQLIDENKLQYESNTLQLLNKLQQNESTVHILEQKLIEQSQLQSKPFLQSQAISSNSLQSHSNINNTNAVQQLSNIVLSKHDPSNTNSKNNDIIEITRLKNDFLLQIAQLRNEYEEKLKRQNEEKQRNMDEQNMKISEQNVKIVEQNEKISNYQKMAYFLNDILLEISDMDNYKSIRQKLDSNRENIIRFYGLSSIDFNSSQSPDLNHRKKGKFDNLGKGYVKTLDFNQSSIDNKKINNKYKNNNTEESYSRISHDNESEYNQNNPIIDYKKRSESNLLNDLHILENMGAQSMHEYMHMRLSKVMQENYELKEENLRYKSSISSLSCLQKNDKNINQNNNIQFTSTPFQTQQFDTQLIENKTQSNNQIRSIENKENYIIMEKEQQIILKEQEILEKQHQIIEKEQEILFDIPQNYIYALFMQAITIEEMLKQAEDVQIITNQIEINQEEQTKLLQQSLEIQKQSLSQQDLSSQQQHQNERKQLQNSIIQERSCEEEMNEEDQNNQYSLQNSEKKNQPLSEQNAQQIHYTPYSKNNHHNHPYLYQS